MNHIDPWHITVLTFSSKPGKLSKVLPFVSRIPWHDFAVAWSLGFLRSWPDRAQDDLRYEGLQLMPSDLQLVFHRFSIVSIGIGQDFKSFLSRFNEFSFGSKGNLLIRKGSYWINLLSMCFSFKPYRNQMIYQYLSVMISIYVIYIDILHLYKTLYVISL